jgi:hypothetical protein
MRKIIAFALVMAVCVLVGCQESAGDKVERKVRNAVDDITK